MGFLVILVLAGGIASFALSMRVSLRLAFVFCLAIALFAVSLLVMPTDTIVKRSNSGELPGMKELQYFVLSTAAGIGAVLGLIAAWITKRMRETAV